MKKKVDPLWRIVGEEVRLQGYGYHAKVECPSCRVPVQLTCDAEEGATFRCGLCGAVSQIESVGSVADDRAPEIVARLAE